MWYIILGDAAEQVTAMEKKFKKILEKSRQKNNKHAMHSRLFYVWHSFEYSRIFQNVRVCVYANGRESERERHSICMYLFAMFNCWYGNWTVGNVLVWLVICGCVSVHFVCTVLGSIVCLSVLCLRTYSARTWFCLVHAVDTAVGYYVAAIRLCCCCCLMRETLTRARPQ